MALVHHRSRWRRCRDDEWLLMLFEGKFTPPVVTGTPRWGVRGMFPFPFHSSSEILLGLSVNSDPEKRKPWSDTPFISRELRLQWYFANGYCVFNSDGVHTSSRWWQSRKSETVSDDVRRQTFLRILLPAKTRFLFGTPTNNFPPIIVLIIFSSCPITNIICQAHDPSIEISTQRFASRLRSAMESGTISLTHLLLHHCNSAGSDFPKSPPNHPHQPASRTDNCLVQQSNHPLGFLADHPG